MNPDAKTCSAAGCGANSELYSFLFFLKVPQNIIRRTEWCDAMGVATQKGRLYCCTRHFDIPGDFDDDPATDKSRGIRLKLKTNVLPHKAIVFERSMKHSYALFEQQKNYSKIDRNFKHLLPAIEEDINVKIPLNIKAAIMNQLLDFVIEKVDEYFKGDRVHSKYQLYQTLCSHRDAIEQLAAQKVAKGTVFGGIPLKTIQPFLQYESEGILSLHADNKLLEQIYFECESNLLKVLVRPLKSTPIQPSDDDYKQLLYSTRVRVHLNLPFFEMVREVIDNSEKYVILDKTVSRACEVKPNGMEKFQKIDKPYRLKSAKVGQYATLEYLDVLIDLLELYDFTLNQRQRATLIYLLKEVREHMQEYEMKELLVTYGCHLSPYKFSRVINDDMEPDTEDSNAIMYIKEIINPELNFQFINAIDADPASIARMEHFFRPIIGHINEDPQFTDIQPYLRFAEQLKNAVLFSCLDCTSSFDAAQSHAAVQEHRECGMKRWTCTNCKATFVEKDIASKKWVHACGQPVQ